MRLINIILLDILIKDSNATVTERERKRVNYENLNSENSSK